MTDQIKKITLFDYKITDVGDELNLVYQVITI